MMAASAWRFIPAIMALCAGLLATSLARAVPPASDADLKAAYRPPSAIPFPKDNSYSAAKAELGRALFFDPRLSGPGNIACASCHNPALSWSDGLPLGIGAGGQKLVRHTPGIMNEAWGRLFMWDGRFSSLEEQALAPMQAPNEMNQPLPALVAKIAAIPGYRRMFDAAFPEEDITPKTISAAIATFERTVVSTKAPFDRWIAGDESAVDQSAKRGFVLFNGKAHCVACHSGWRFTDDSFHDIGLKNDDIGRGKFKPEIPILLHAFKTPGLRNVAQRAPYMHDGSIPTLAAVMHEYNDGFVQRPSLSPEIKPLHLSDSEMDDVVAFMLALTSRDESVTIPMLPTKEAR
jgi:cytochrome c peroxidase